jgi:thiol-disulfide isomerase/thioredoxin
MTASRCVRLGVLVVLLGLVGTVRADEFPLDLTPDDIVLGKQVLGPQVQPGDLKHKVVLMEFWGVNCGPCLASMPKLSAWNAELSGQGLMILGIHAQDATAEKIRATALSRGVNFPIIENARFKKAPKFNTIPHCMLFNHEGKCLFRGSPSGVELAMRRAVAAAPAPILEGRKLTKLVALGQAVKKEQNLGSALKQARAKEESTDEAVAAEAKYLVEKITARGRKQLDDAAAGKEDQPALTLAMLQKVAANFKGDGLAKEASEQLSELKKDKDFQAALKVEPMLQRLKTLRGQLRSLPSDPNDTTSAAYRKLNAAVLNQMKQTIRTMHKTAPQARATQQALEIAEVYSLLPG